jgi:hypothetical protein
MPMDTHNLKVKRVVVPPAVGYDWRWQGTEKKGELEFGVDFYGPGLYLTKTDTLLVLPRDAAPDLWEWDKHPGTVYDWFVFNCRYEETLIGYLLGTRSELIPIRSDTR